MIAIIDHNVGNFQNAESAFTRIGLPAVVTRDHALIKRADAIVLPGVGSFPAAMSNLIKHNLVGVLQEQAGKGVPLLGICLGMQVLFEKGSENVETTGLGLLDGEIHLIQTNEKLPHMGWNQLHLTKPHLLTKYLKNEDEVYFVHSYAAICPDEEIIAYTTYGATRIPAIVGRKNVMGCQFHPEKSGPVGQLILKAFKEMIQ